MNVHESVTALEPVPVVVLVEPMISTKSVAFPPVQLRGKPALRFTVEGKPPVRVMGVPTVIDVLNLPTSLPPAPATVYCPATMVPVPPPTPAGRPVSASVSE